MSHAKTPIIFIAASVFCPVLLFIGYLPTIPLEDRLTYSGQIDTAFVIKMLTTIMSYLVFFVLTIKISQKLLKQSLSRLFIIGIALQFLFWRFAAIGLGHVDCGNRCATNIIPESQDYLILIITATSLLVSAYWLWKRQSVKPLQS